MSKLFHKRKTVHGFVPLKQVSKSTLLILKEAERRGVAWEKIPYTDVFSLQYDGKTAHFHGQVPSATTELAHHCCKNKNTAKSLLEKAGLSVSRGYVVSATDDHQSRQNIFDSLRKPLVVKPVDGMRGSNVHLNVSTEEEYEHALSDILVGSGTDALVEQMFAGNEYRILATREKILSVIKRLPANVRGDGISTIAQLITTKNKNPLRETVATYRMIGIDNEVEKFLSGQGLTPQSVPAEGERVFLRPHCSLDISLGGDTVDVTDTIHPSVHHIVRTAMKSIPGLALAGIDYLSTDIHREQTPASYQIIEVNTSPSLDWNEFPLQGPHRKVAYEFLRLMFPEL